MPIDFAGAAVGAAFNELFSLVNRPVKTVAAFRGRLKKIQTTLGNIEPIIKDIDQLNNLLHRSPEEMAPIKLLLEQGQRLVSKCSKIHKLNLYGKYKHSRKLTRFNAELLQRFQLSTPLLNARVDVKEIRGCVKEIKRLAALVCLVARWSLLVLWLFDCVTCSHLDSNVHADER